MLWYEAIPVFIAWIHFMEMARQVVVARHLRWSFIVLRKAGPSLIHNRRLLSTTFATAASKLDTPFPSNRPNTVHKSVVTHLPNLQALRHVRRLLQQPDCRVLLLTGSSISESPVRAALERDSSVFELERHGHGLYGVREFCQLLLRESGHDRRVFSRAQLTALMLYHGLALPRASPLAATSMLQRRKEVQDLLQLFHLLEQEGITANEYAAVIAPSNTVVPQKLVEAYRRYQDLLVQHNATSWDGLVMEVAAMCGLQDTRALHQNGTTANAFSQVVLSEYTDVVIDNVERITPAMATVVGHLCGQPSVQSSASFSRVRCDKVDCVRTQLLEQQLLKTAACTGNARSVSRLCVPLDATNQADKRAHMHQFAKQIMTQDATGHASTRARCPIPLKCWTFKTSKAEEAEIGAFLSQNLRCRANFQATVLCPSYADASRIRVAFQQQGLSVQVAHNHLAARATGTGKPIHLFDEPGVNAVYSLLCALCFPSDSRHLYNILRSDYVAFPATVLSWIMEKEHRSNVDLFAVLEAFVESQGAVLGTSRAYKDRKGNFPQPKASALESGLQKAKAFVNLIKRLRAKCHDVSAAELVQLFLEASGRLERLVNPSSSAQERESLAFADFLRELETAQSIVQSDQVTFVVPYLQQLRATSLTSCASSEGTRDGQSTHSMTSPGCVRVFPLAKHALESLASFVAKDNDNPHVLVLMSMRDSKFPGRMKRLTLPLPYELLTKPYPVQTRSEHLQQCEQLIYEAMMLAEYNEVVLSFAELASSSSTKVKREVLSRTLQPIWHDGDEPEGVTLANDSGATRSLETTLSPKFAASQHVSCNQVAYTKNKSGAPFKWLSKAVRAMGELVQRMSLSNVAVTTGLSTRNNDTSGTTAAHQQHNKVTRSDENIAKCGDTYRSRALAVPRVSYEPSHLSYSQISEYRRCPHQYYLSRVLKLNGEVSPSMMFGRALHLGVAAFATSLAEAQERGQVTEEAKTLAAVAAKEALVRAWVGDGFGLYTSKKQASLLLERGMTALSAFIETHYTDLHFQAIVNVEQEFSIYVHEADVELRGVWDRIDRVSRLGADSSSFVIQEFKSNLSGAQRNMQQLAVDSLQLKLYMYAFRKVYGEAPYGATLQQIGGNHMEEQRDSRKSNHMQHSHRQNDNKGFVPFSEKAELESIGAIVEVASGLRGGVFDPNPTFAACAFCPYVGSACHFATDSVVKEQAMR